MRKLKRYQRTYFDANILRMAKDKFDELSKNDSKFDYSSFEVTNKLETWSYNNFEEFLAEYRKDYSDANFSFRYKEHKLEVISSKVNSRSTIWVESNSRHEIETIFGIFDDNASRFYVPPSNEEIENEKAVIFIGHGHSDQWRDLKDHLHEKHNYKVEAYETGARAGHTIRDILESMLDNSSFALLVLTGEDETKSSDLLARQNVIHEAGLFQGRLGFNKAIILLEDGTKEFSNIQGIQQIRFSKNKIKETFGDVLATIRREFNKE